MYLPNLPFDIESGVVCQSVSNKNNSVLFSKSQIATENSNLSSNCLKYQYYHVPSRPFQGCSTRTTHGCFPEVKQQNLCIKRLTENNHIFQRNLFLYHNLHPYSILGSLLLSHLSEWSPFRRDTAKNNLSDPFIYFNSSSHEPCVVKFYIPLTWKWYILSSGAYLFWPW